jgi:dolichol-phosphate mannosyltransferase
MRRRYIDKYGTWSHLAQFLVVGSSGLVVNLALLTGFLYLRVPSDAAVALAIALSMVWNFSFNRRFSFSYARRQAVWPQLLGFVAACSLGAVINYFVTSSLWDAFQVKQAAAFVGVVAGTASNFIASRYVVFRAD